MTHVTTKTYCVQNFWNDPRITILNISNHGGSLYVPQDSQHTYNVTLRGARATIVTVKGKGKAVPLQAWGDPEGSRKLTFPDFMTTA
jgi:hypothetical protein